MQNKTSYGQNLLRERLKWFIKGTPIENYRGSWLYGMELDFFYIEHGLAFINTAAFFKSSAHPTK